MKVLYFIGADLSKDSIDLACHELQSHLRIENSEGGFKELLRWLKGQSIDPAQVLLVMEHTGLYSYHLEAFLHREGIAFAKVSPLTIKRSSGLVRGKNDKIDAERLARYGFEKRDVLLPMSKAEPTLERLAMLHTTRERLVRHRASLLCALKQYQGILAKTDVLIQSQLILVRSFTAQIKKVEAQIRALTQNEDSLKQKALLLQSVVGVGPVLSVATLVKTKNFTAFPDARKFACYCGTAPFEHSSGSSIRGRTRVSPLADKGMKTLLEQAARSAVQHDEELRAFYQRRLQMGKSKRSTLNIVRNKILYRMFAVVKRGTPFVKAYRPAA